MSRTASTDAALRAGGLTGDVMLDEEPAAAGADCLRISCVIHPVVPLVVLVVSP